jgi:hypothetical protein
MLASAPSARHILGPMAGSPLKRQRKAGVIDATGEIVAFPHMPRVADLPRDWRRRSPAEKLQHLLGMSLDRAAEILSWSPAELDPLRLSVQVQVWRVVFVIGIKALLDGKLGREAARERKRAAVLDELARRFRDKPNSAAPEA